MCSVCLATLSICDRYIYWISLQLSDFSFVCLFWKTRNISTLILRSHGICLEKSNRYEAWSLIIGFHFQLSNNNNKQINKIVIPLVYFYCATRILHFPKNLLPLNKVDIVSISFFCSLTVVKLQLGSCLLKVDIPISFTYLYRHRSKSEYGLCFDRVWSHVQRSERIECLRTYTRILSLQFMCKIKSMQSLWYLSSIWSFIHESIQRRPRKRSLVSLNVS